MILLLLACTGDKIAACGDEATLALPGQEGAALVYLDNDGDGFGNPDALAMACGVPDGFTTQAGDCDDHDADANPDGVELCGGGDEDCDGETDEYGEIGRAHV